MSLSVKALFSVLKEDVCLSLWFECWGWNHGELFCVCPCARHCCDKRLCGFIGDLIGTSQAAPEMGVIVTLPKAELRGSRSHQHPHHRPVNDSPWAGSQRLSLGKNAQVCLSPKLWVEALGSHFYTSSALGADQAPRPYFGKSMCVFGRWVQCYPLWACVPNGDLCKVGLNSVKPCLTCPWVLHPLSTLIVGQCELGLQSSVLTEQHFTSYSLNICF